MRVCSGYLLCMFLHSIGTSVENFMEFEKISQDKITKLENNALIELYKQTKVWLREGYDRAKKEGNAEEFIEKLIIIEDEMKKRDIPLLPKYYCEYCKKFWNNDAYCPHTFDEDKLYRLYQKAIFGKIRILTNGFEFYDSKGKYIGKYDQ